MQLRVPPAPQPPLPPIPRCCAHVGCACCCTIPPCRDRTNPKEWYLPKNLYELPPEMELEKTPAENIAVSAWLVEQCTCFLKFSKHSLADIVW